jgi:putative restriction endonuclease
MEFDFPVFKVLAHNDTGAAAGHQGGIVIPKDLENYFPDLSDRITAGQPTVDQFVEAELVLNATYMGNVSTRYQLQTWSGPRSPERRLTGELGALRNVAVGGDIMLFQRHLEDPWKYRITLITHDSPAYKDYLREIGEQRWGLLRASESPIGNQDILEELTTQKDLEDKEFQLFSDRLEMVTTQKRKWARAFAFRIRTLSVYSNKCAITGVTLLSPSGRVGLDAAHIVPVHRNGRDDVRNGLCLTKGLHWAFDNGLFSLSDDLRVIVPNEVRAIPDNKILREIDGLPIRAPLHSSHSISALAARWHRENIMLRVPV